MAIQPNVFISYSADTKPFAEKLTEALKEQGIQSWASFKDLKPGDRLQDELHNALEWAQWFVILVNPKSRASHWQESEWRAALEKVWSDSEKIILPLVVGGDEPPPFLRRWVSLRIDPNAESAKWTKEVVEALHSTRNQRTQALSSRDKQARLERLNEMARAAEELGRRERQHDTGATDRKP